MSSTRRTSGRRTRLITPAACLLAAACADAEAEHRLEEGRYHYAASHPAPGSVEPMQLEGVMVITFSEEDSIAGRWEVPELHPDMDLGNWEETAYEVMAHPTYFGILTHRVRPGAADGEILCEGDYTWVAEGGIERTVPVACSISREAIERPEMPERGPEDPIVREIDEDTLPPAGLSPDDRAGAPTDTTRPVR